MKCFLANPKSGAAGCVNGFVTYFLEVPLACFGSMAAAVQPNCLWNSQKTLSKTFYSTCRPTLYLNSTFHFFLLIVLLYTGLDTAWIFAEVSRAVDRRNWYVYFSTFQKWYYYFSRLLYFSRLFCREDSWVGLTLILAVPLSSCL